MPDSEVSMTNRADDRHGRARPDQVRRSRATDEPEAAGSAHRDAARPAEPPDPAEFSRRTEPFRRELLAHCYRMAGSLDEAEDLVQETYLRAWRGYPAFAGRSSVRVWLYKIATNACLNDRRQQIRRPLPSGLGAPSADADVPPRPPAPGPDWPQPIPDALVISETADPADIVSARESLRLALMDGLQRLPGRQRAVLVLRDVLDFSAAEVAAMLGGTVPAVKSLLQRARAGMNAAGRPGQNAPEPDDPAVRALFEQYVRAFENADLAALERALREDAALEIVGSPAWFSGIETCLRQLGRVVGSPGDWRMTPVRANGQPAAAAYFRDAGGGHRAFGVAVLTVAADGIVRIVLYRDPELFPRFGLPPAC
ncbi:DNA-directed RNA polymerase sigma-70 factor [Sphaerisporangium rufum]|uniref:DNA-directed RNA polymerase sigma-70 factor n=1 Tax=Sphaerisporangium rufum TaxID=1381558 RepID=A0A919R569_9ACTN|nr:RNA polymerase subunit sigma-70 [Sphaerisporangium rufum]GII78520.1 DNA-directed RNA polymerase sigma-70 factor [Sphaerisporangium rufum]